jgi:F0F1-type ATP synthase membrane subunit a
VVPIEFFSTFILRPVTLTIRLMANMLAGHIIPFLNVSPNARIGMPIILAAVAYIARELS